MNFGNCVWSYNHHKNQYIEQSPHLKNLPWVYLLSLLSSHLWLLATTYLLSVTIFLFCFFIEFYMNEIIQYIVFYVQLLSLA